MLNLLQKNISLHNLTKRSKHICVGNRIVLEKDSIDSPNTQIHDGILSCLGTGISIQSGGVNYGPKLPMLVK